MKKIILLIFALISLSVNAQIYNHKTIYDKFDDTILDKNQKTLVTRTDSSFVIEEKGSKPVCYRIINYADYNSMGSKDEIVNLVDNVYGYQECWHVVLEKDYVSYYIGLSECVLETDEKKRTGMITKLLDKYSYYITHRVVTTQYAKIVTGDYLWVQKGDNNGRTIYGR